MSLMLLRALGGAVIKNAPRALLGCLPFGEALYDIARDTLTDWKAACKAAAQRRLTRRARKISSYLLSRFLGSPFGSR